MRTRKFKLCVLALAMTGLSLASSPALAVVYNLMAGTVDVPDPNGGASIRMWGYADCPSGFGSPCSAIQVPGPALTVPDTDSVLTVNLLNSLAEPTSLVINGLRKPMVPVFFTDAEGRRRVRSFDAEAMPGAAAIQYQWAGVRPGTYLYQSGTQPQKQVQMGLYGAVTRNAVDPVGTTAGQAYAGIAYDNQVTLLYSEIDLALHAAVAGGTYGPCPIASPDCGNLTSTLNYKPSYFMINGVVYPHASLKSMLPVGLPGTTLVRMLNAGLTTRVPMVLDKRWDLVAEDGNAYANRRTQYTALLPAAKTMDAVLTATTPVAVMDRRLGLSNAGVPDGGMLAVLNLGVVPTLPVGTTPPANLPPEAVDDTYSSVSGISLSVAAPGVLVNDSDPDAGPYPIKAVASSGTTGDGNSYSISSNGSITFTPATPGTLSDSFPYQVTDGQLVASATVTVNLAEPLLPSVALVDDFTRADAAVLGVANWSQAVNTGPNAADLHIVGDQVLASAVDLGGQAIYNAASYGAKQGASIRLTGTPDKSAIILKASGGTAESPANFIRARFEAATNQVVIATMLGGSNTTSYVNHRALPAATLAGGGTLTATADANGLVLVWGNSIFIGGVQLPRAAAWTGSGRAGIQLQTVGATADDFRAATLP
jgi:hypothetical protein